MEHNKDSSSSGHGSNFMGAIFMCSNSTKHICFKRNIFGLPPSHADFVKKVKAGMLLFLFEPEVRQLNGVFEATSDGAMNIDCGAFYKYPAQVRFKILWKCHPLSEDEFGGVIHENYLTDTMFYLGLSYEQVCKFIELFSSKKINPRNHSSLGLHRTNSRMGNCCMTRRAKSARFDTMKDCTDNNTNSRSGYNWKYTMYYRNPDLTFEGINIGIGHRSYPIVPGVSQPQLPNLKHSSCYTDHHLILPTFEAEQSYDILGAGIPSLAQKRPDTCTPNLRNHLHQSNPDSYTVDLPSTDFHILDSYKVVSVDEPNLTQRFTETPAPHFRSHSYSPQPFPETLSLPSTNNSSSVVSSIHDDLPLQNDSYTNSPHFVKYNNSSTSKCHANNATDSLPSVLSPSSHKVDNARGLRYWKLLPDNQDENLVMNVEPPQLTSRYSSEPSSVNERGSREDYYFQSDVFQKRTSVFFRLSKAEKGRWQRDNTCEPHTNSLDLLGLLSQRRKQWIKALNNSDPWGNDDGNDKRLRNPYQMELVGVDSLADLFSDSEAVAEDCIVPPFLNFKRRSEAEIEEGEIRESDLVEDVIGKCKRKKLVRPSLTEVDTFIQTDSENKGTAALEDCLSNGNHMNSKDPLRVSAMFRIGVSVTGENIFSSKKNGKEVDMTDANAENVSVEPGVECTFEGKDSEGDPKNEKESGSNSNLCSLEFDVSFNKISVDSDKTEQSEEHIVTSYLNCEGDKSDEISEKNEPSYENLVNVDTVEMREGDNSEVVYVKERSFFDGKVQKASFESDANFSQATAHAKSGTMEEDLNVRSELRCESDSVICSLSS